MSNFIDPALVPKRRLYTGEEIPCIGMGTFGSDRFSAEEISNAVYGAIKCGYRLFDCASVYQNEDQIGEVFEKAFKNGLVKREELHITSKVWNDMHGKGDVLLSLAKTLKDLKLDYVDTFFLHWPFPNYHAPATPGIPTPGRLPWRSLWRRGGSWSGFRKWGWRGISVCPI